MMQKSMGSIGHRKHRAAYGQKRNMKSPRMRLQQRMDAEDPKHDRKRHKAKMVPTIKQLFEDG